jgi:hypothetical protein
MREFGTTHLESDDPRSLETYCSDQSIPEFHGFFAKKKPGVLFTTEGLADGESMIRQYADSMGIRDLVIKERQQSSDGSTISWLMYSISAVEDLLIQRKELFELLEFEQFSSVEAFIQSTADSQELFGILMGYPDSSIITWHILQSFGGMDQMWNTLDVGASNYPRFSELLNKLNNRMYKRGNGFDRLRGLLPTERQEFLDTAAQILQVQPSRLEVCFSSGVVLDSSIGTYVDSRVAQSVFTN